jgi:membrane-associated protease RseP (regulator of RpoE activity)
MSAAPPDASEPPPSSAADGSLPPLRWKVNAVLFVATVFSVFLTGAKVWGDGLAFAIPLLSILLTHEFGHFVAARIHRVDASLPYFIPLPFLSPFGTMGAVINMRGRIRSRNALLDIGAAGPLAGLCVAIPVLVVGLLRSPVGPNGEHYLQEGQCLLYMAIKRIVIGPIPAGHDVQLTPMALAGWAGLFVTMLNLVPVAQLDGGHIAYALFGAPQNRAARVLHNGLFLVFGYNFVRAVWPLAERHDLLGFPSAIRSTQVLFWFLWYLIIHVIMRFGGTDHPPTEPGELSPVRKGLAVLSLVLFVLLFMPTPWAEY